MSPETGINPELVTIIAHSRDEHFYDLPDDLKGRMWGGKYRGQRQIWFLMQFHGTDADINIETKHQEFSNWRWSDIDDLDKMLRNCKSLQ